MKTETVTSPSGWVMSDLLRIMETTEDTFREGRRNNDLVNWFLIKRAIDLEKGIGVGTARFNGQSYVDDFRVLREQLTSPQQTALSLWSEDPEWKIKVLFEHYGAMSREQQLFNLWLPMEYDMDAGQVEGQLELV